MILMSSDQLYPLWNGGILKSVILSVGFLGLFLTVKIGHLKLESDCF